jgi:shikimate kinase
MARADPRPRTERRIVALVGLRCSGKSSVGRELARLLGRPFVDLDDEVAFLAGSESAGAVIEELGLGAFRRLEARALERVLTAGAPGVLATGGGVVEQPLNRQWLALHTRCVWLRAEPALLRARLLADRALRPSLTGAAPADELEALSRERAPLYAEVAEHALDVGEASPLALAQRIAALL